MNDSELRSKVETILEELRPNLQMDGGDVEFVRYADGIVYVRFHGACVGCPMSTFTLKMGLEEAIREHMPEVIEVVAVDEHDGAF